jgi:hypothetical protein
MAHTTQRLIPIAIAFTMLAAQPAEAVLACYRLSTFPEALKLSIVSGPGSSKE